MLFSLGLVLAAIVSASSPSDGHHGRRDENSVQDLAIHMLEARGATTTKPLTGPTAKTLATSTLQTSLRPTPVSATLQSYDLKLTTVFTAPPQCTGQAQKLAMSGSHIWQNAIIPNPSLTATSCYPDQFHSSVVAAASGVALPAFQSLVCPHQWQSFSYNETYHVCCPYNFGVIAPHLSSLERPLSGATCTSVVTSGMVLDVTSYGPDSSSTIVEVSASHGGFVVLATGFDGFGTATATAKLTGV